MTALLTVLMLLLVNPLVAEDLMGPPAPRPRHEAAVRVVSVERFQSSRTFAKTTAVISTVSTLAAFIHTEIDLSKGEHFREMNPLMQHPWARRIGKPLLHYLGVRKLMQLAKSPRDSDHTMLRWLGWVAVLWTTADLVTHIHHSF